jgi:hypothetical protein
MSQSLLLRRPCFNGSGRSLTHQIMLPIAPIAPISPASCTHQSRVMHPSVPRHAPISPASCTHHAMHPIMQCTPSCNAPPLTPSFIHSNIFQLLQTIIWEIFKFSPIYNYWGIAHQLRSQLQFITTISAKMSPHHSPVSLLFIIMQTILLLLSFLQHINWEIFKLYSTHPSFIIVEE